MTITGLTRGMWPPAGSCVCLHRLGLSQRITTPLTKICQDGSALLSLQLCFGHKASVIETPGRLGKWLLHLTKVGC